MSSMRPVPAAVVAFLLLAALAAVPAGAQVQSAHPIPTTGPAPSTPGFVGHAATPRPARRRARRPGRTRSWRATRTTTSTTTRGRPTTTRSRRAARAPAAGVLDRDRPHLHHADLRPPGPADRRPASNLDQGPAPVPASTRVTLDTLAFLQLPFVPPPAGTNPALEHDRRRVLLPRQPGPRRRRHRRPPASRRRSGGRARRRAGVPSRRRRTTRRRACTPASGCRRCCPTRTGRLWFVGRTHGTVGVLDPKTGQVRLDRPRRGDRELVRDRHATASTSSPTSAQYKFRAGAGPQARRSSGGPPTATSASRSPARSTPARARRRRSSRLPAAPAGAYGARVRGDHRQRRPDGRRRLPRRRPARARAEARRLHGARLRARARARPRTRSSSLGRSLFVENNYGYDLAKFNDVIAGGTPIGGDRGLVSSPGIARVDIDRGRHAAAARSWDEHTRSGPPSVVAKGDSANGLVYTYENVTRPAGPGRRPVVLDGARLPHRARSSGSSSPATAAVQQPLRRDRARPGPARPGG